jgi:uncharacterized damage-inducible protein DinB
MSIGEMMIPEFDQEVQNTRKTLALLPDGQFDYKPHAKSMALGRLAGHVAEMTGWISHVLKTDELHMTAKDVPCIAKSRAELLEQFDKMAAESREALSKATDEQMAAIWTLTWEGKQIFAIPRVACIRGMCLNHTIHHRAQLGVYYRLLGIAVPGVYGPSADEMESMQASA